MKNSIFLVLLAGFSQTAFASGTTIGNGGFVLSCASKIQILDHYEITQRGFNIEPAQGQTLEMKVESQLKKLEAIDPNRAKSYRYQYENIWKKNLETYNIEGLHLNSKQVLDPKIQTQFGLGSVRIPDGCELILALHQTAPEDYTDNRRGIKVTAYLPVWNRLDLDTQAALIMHELFYREYLITQLTGRNSMGIRYLNGYLSSYEFRKLSSDTWIPHLNYASLAAMFPAFQLNGVAADLERVPTCFGLSYGVRLPGSTTLDGQINLKGNPPLKIEAFHWTSCFYDGLIPNYFKLKKTSDIDMSAFAGVPLILNVDANCDINVDSGSNILRIGQYLCKSFLSKYSHDSIMFSGPIVASYSVEGSHAGWVPQLRLLKTPFSILQNRTTSGDWLDVDLIEINLKTGQIISAGKCPGCALP